MKPLILSLLAVWSVPWWLTSELAQAQQAIAPVPAPSSTIPQWRIRFFHDENTSALGFDSLVAPAPGVVCAFGGLAADGKRPQGIMVTSRDAGKSWQTVKLPDLPVSADFFDANTGWLVVRDAVYRTTDGGLTWPKSAKLKGVLRVKFVTAQRGFAIGFPKAVWSTVDGGATWAKVPEAQAPASKAENTTYTTITFTNDQRGLITGFSKPPRRDESRVPPWMDPETQKRLVPNLTVILQTQDGGKTWKSEEASAFGQVATVVVARGGQGLALMEYTAGSFSHASEIVNLTNGKTAFLDKEKAVRDLALDSDGRVWLAGVEVLGKLNQLPIPSKVIVQQSIDYEHWYPVPVDYKAVANRVKIAFSGKTGWMATDTGMILLLQ